MLTYHKQGAAHTVSVVPTSGPHAGKPVGTGYGYTARTAEYFACIDAVRGGHFDAGCGHAQYLNEQDEAAVRRLAQHMQGERS